MTEQEKEEKHYTGHYKRLRERFLKDNGASMPDYEIVEYLLHIIYRRQDVKPKAKMLLSKHGSYVGLMTASVDSLRKDGLSDWGISVFKMLLCATRRLSSQKLHESNVSVLADKFVVIDHCRTMYGHERIEHCGLIYLNSKYEVIYSETVQKGTIDQLAIYIREIIKGSLVNGAHGLIMCHNHPGGDPKPSIADAESTLKLIESMKNVSLQLVDHIIITKEDHYSFSENFLLDKNSLEEYIRKRKEEKKLLDQLRLEGFLDEGKVDQL